MHLLWHQDAPEVITLLAGYPALHTSNGDAGPADERTGFYSFARLTDLTRKQQKLTHFVLHDDGSLRQEDMRYLSVRR